MVGPIKKKQSKGIQSGKVLILDRMAKNKEIFEVTFEQTSEYGRTQV